MNQWLNESMKGWMDERVNETWGMGWLQCYAVSPWPPPIPLSSFSSLSSRLIGWGASMLLQSYGGYPPISSAQRLQFMNESGKNALTYGLHVWESCLCSWILFICIHTHKNVSLYSYVDNFVCWMCKKTYVWYNFLLFCWYIKMFCRNT